MMPKVVIILVNYNGFTDTVDCLKSLKLVNYPNNEIIVVDNGSTVVPDPEDIRYIRENALLLESNSNLGFSGGNNIGIKEALNLAADYILLLNNDTVVEPDFLIELVKVAEKKKNVGIVGGKIKYYSAPDIIWFGGGSYDDNSGYVWHERYNQQDEGNTGDVIEQSFITGCLMLIPVGVIRKVGTLSEEFFLYAEDTEFSCRVRHAGYKLWFCENVVIYHKVSASTGAGSYQSTYYSVRNTLFVAKRYCHSMMQCYRTYGFLWAKKIIKGKMKLKPTIRGVFDYWRGLTGPLQ